MSDKDRNFHTERLQTLGMIAGGVAHDFNNILAGILGHVSYLKNILPASGSHVESLTAIEEGGIRASVMTQQILNFSRYNSEESSARPTGVNVNELVAKTMILLRGAISKVYSLDHALPPAPLFVLANEGGLAQVLVNLVINARDALAANGTIKVSIGQESDLKVISDVFKGADLSSRNYVTISVEDNGHGMSTEVMERMFEPYFSTKKDKGNGLGLATVSAIVKGFGGAIKVHSEVGKGTNISVFLPAMESNSSRSSGEPKRSERPSLPGGDERILVVDDEAPVRNVLALSLGHLGYKVDNVGSGAEALELFTKIGYDLVILDMLMPIMTGEELFFKLREINPNIRVIAISGYTSEDSVKNVLRHGGSGFMQKPFTIDDLSKTVRKCIDS